MKRIAINLTDDLTLGALRRMAQAVGKNLVVTFDAARRQTKKRVAVKRSRRRMTAAQRLALVRNAALARAALARKRALAA